MVVAWLGQMADKTCGVRPGSAPVRQRRFEELLMADHVPQVIIKLATEAAANLRYADGAEDDLRPEQRLAWDGVAAALGVPAMRLSPALANMDVARVRDQLVSNASFNHSPSANLLSYFAVPVAPGEALAVAAALRSLPFVESAHVSRATSLPAVAFADEPFIAGQGYLAAQPVGIGAIDVFALPFADGAVTRFVDVEYSWQLNHEDLQDDTVPPISVLPTGLVSIDPDFVDHGTAVLGIVLGRDNTVGVIGIAPKVHGMVAPVLSSGGTVALATVLAALLTSDEVPPGSIVLIEQQIEGDLPVELDVLVRHAILELTRKGVIVIEAAGNGGADLDTLTDPFFGDVLNPQSSSFFDSGAIFVAAGTSAMPHARLAFSNHGKRIDCFAWGENILTCAATVQPAFGLPYQPDFAGTSGASAIVAGASIVLQNIRRSVLGDNLLPSAMRALLGSPTFNTLPSDPDIGRIGVMPDLVQLATVVTSS
jgi:hypothetical protein